MLVIVPSSDSAANAREGSVDSRLSPTASVTLQACDNCLGVSAFVNEQLATVKRAGLARHRQVHLYVLLQPRYTKADCDSCTAHCASTGGSEATHTSRGTAAMVQPTVRMGINQTAAYRYTGSR